MNSNISTQPEKKISQSYTRKIGSTTYIVNVHFNRQTAETLEDKVKRLVRKEVEGI